MGVLSVGILQREERSRLLFYNRLLFAVLESVSYQTAVPNMGEIRKKHRPNNSSTGCSGSNRAAYLAKAESLPPLGPY
jgi:hypothetical protein